METFIIEGNLNRRQEYIIRTRVKGHSIAEQALHLHLSIDQVNKEIAKLKKIYDMTQEHSLVLPPRSKNHKELLRQSLAQTKDKTRGTKRMYMV